MRMRLAGLSLLAVSLQAEPITFSFHGTWDFTPPLQRIAGAVIEQGAPLGGSFTWDGSDGHFDFAIGGVQFLHQSAYEDPLSGWGFLFASTEEALCDTTGGSNPGPFPCQAALVFRGPRETGFGGDGTQGHFLFIHGTAPTFSISAGAKSRDIEISPYLPFAVYEQYVVPEPATLLLVGAGLLLLARKLRR
jgi:hypothetical protein